MSNTMVLQISDKEKAKETAKKRKKKKKQRHDIERLYKHDIKFVAYPQLNYLSQYVRFPITKPAGTANMEIMTSTNIIDPSIHKILHPIKPPVLSDPEE